MTKVSEHKMIRLIIVFNEVKKNIFYFCALEKFKMKIKILTDIQHAMK